MTRLLVALLLVAELGCTADAQPAVRVLAAASLTESFTAAAEQFERSGQGAVELSFAGSQTLLAQLDEGAEADVLATADEVSMQSGVDRGLVERPRVFASNALVVVVPTANPAGVTTVADLARPGVKLVLAGAQVPAGRYARAALAAADLDAALANVVSEEEDVKGVVGKVVSAEADAGIVYATDVTAQIADRVEVVLLDTQGLRIRYPIAVTVTADPAAEAFVEFMVTGDGAGVLRAAGFGPP